MTIDSTPSPLPPTATGNYLTRGAVAFTGWGKIPSAPPYNPTPLTTYNGYENIIATASYGHSFNGTVDLETLTEMDAGNIIFEHGGPSLNPLTPVIPDASFNVDIPKKQEVITHGLKFRLKRLPFLQRKSIAICSARCTLETAYILISKTLAAILPVNSVSFQRRSIFRKNYLAGKSDK